MAEIKEREINELNVIHKQSSMERKFEHEEYTQFTAYYYKHRIEIIESRSTELNNGASYSSEDNSRRSILDAKSRMLQQLHTILSELSQKRYDEVEAHEKVLLDTKVECVENRPADKVNLCCFCQKTVIPMVDEKTKIETLEEYISDELVLSDRNAYDEIAGNLSNWRIELDKLQRALKGKSEDTNGTPSCKSSDLPQRSLNAEEEFGKKRLHAVAAANSDVAEPGKTDSNRDQPQTQTTTAIIEKAKPW